MHRADFMGKNMLPTYNFDFAKWGQKKVTKFTKAMLFDDRSQTFKKKEL